MLPQIIYIIGVIISYHYQRKHCGVIKSLCLGFALLWPFMLTLNVVEWLHKKFT